MKIARKGKDRGLQKRRCSVNGVPALSSGRRKGGSRVKLLNFNKLYFREGEKSKTSQEKKRNGVHYSHESHKGKRERFCDD